MDQLTRLLHIRQANWRPSRLTVAAYQFWCKSTQIWRWLYAHTDIKTVADIQRTHLYAYIDTRLAAGYKTSTINIDLHAFQATLRFLQQQGIAVPASLLSLPGLKKPQALPRFLTDAQIEKLKADLVDQGKHTATPHAHRLAQLDLAIFYLLWQTGMRISELEDLVLDDLFLPEQRLVIRRAKGLKDRTVYLTASAVKAVEAYLAVRGPAVSDHVFIYRHKPLSKDLVRSRLKTAGRRIQVKVTPHMLRHTFATQLVNAGCRITTIQALLGHKRLNTTQVYARVHSETIAQDYYTAMAEIERQSLIQSPVEEQFEDPARLLEILSGDNLTTEQQIALEKLHMLLAQKSISDQFTLSQHNQ